VEKLLGEGSFGKVFQVELLKTGKKYALKSMQKQFLISNNQIKYAVTEAEIMKGLEHPFVLQLEYCFQTPEYLHMVMELVEHGDLSQQLDHLNYLEEPIARFITAELILAMEYVHSKNVLFRDLKPENILISA
jgi:serum/glucocorticoid-regulated kinase 2